MRPSSFAIPSTHVGAETDTAPSTSALAGAGAALPALVLGAVGAVFGGTLWGTLGLVGGALAGAGAGYGVAKLTSGSKAEDAKEPSKHPPGVEPELPGVPKDFSLPQPGTFTPPKLGELPKMPFPDVPTFLPTPSAWLPVSVNNSRDRVAMHRGLPKGAEITFIAQYGIRSETDTSDEIKLAGTILVSRNAIEDRDPAYGVEVTQLVSEHNIGDSVTRPTIGQRMAVAPDQVLTSNVGGTSGFSKPNVPPWLRRV